MENLLGQLETIFDGKLMIIATDSTMVNIQTDIVGGNDKFKSKFKAKIENASDYFLTYLGGNKYSITKKVKSKKEETEIVNVSNAEKLHYQKCLSNATVGLMGDNVKSINTEALYERFEDQCSRLGTILLGWVGFIELIRISDYCKLDDATEIDNSKTLFIYPEKNAPREVNKDTQIGTSLTGDLMENTWTFEMSEGFSLSAGEFAIVPNDEYKKSLKQKKDLLTELERARETLIQRGFKAESSTIIGIDNAINNAN